MGFLKNILSIPLDLVEDVATGFGALDGEMNSKTLDRLDDLSGAKEAKRQSDENVLTLHLIDAVNKKQERENLNNTKLAIALHNTANKKTKIDSNEEIEKKAMSNYRKEIEKRNRDKTKQTKEIIKLWGIDFDFGKLSEMYEDEKYDDIREYFESKGFKNISDNEYFFWISNNKHLNIGIGFQGERILIKDENKERGIMLLYL